MPQQHMRTPVKTIGTKRYALHGTRVLVTTPQRPPSHAVLGIILDTAFWIPPRTGVGHRLYGLSRAIVRAGIEVRLFLCNRNYENDEAAEVLREVKNLEIHLIPEEHFYNPRTLCALVGRRRPDILQFEDPETLLLLGRPLQRALGAPLVLEVHDVLPLLLASLGASAATVERARVLQYTACQAADLTVCMTSSNIQELFTEVGVGSSRLVLAPNGVDVREAPFYGPKVSARNVIFIGNQYYPPNAKAAALIATRILPAVHRRRPDIRFTIAGMGPTDLYRRIARQQNLRCPGFVTDLNALLRDATIAIAPIVAGSGMKTKILHYAAAGLPIVATPEAARGYEGMDGMIITDNIAEFSRIILDLLDNPRRMRGLGKQNRLFVVRDFTWSRIARQLTNDYRQILRDASHRWLATRSRTRGLGRIPNPFWLTEKRVQPNPNPTYYIVRRSNIRKQILTHETGR